MSVARRRSPAAHLLAQLEITPALPPPPHRALTYGTSLSPPPPPPPPPPRRVLTYGSPTDDAPPTSPGASSTLAAGPGASQPIDTSGGRRQLSRPTTLPTAPNHPNRGHGSPSDQQAPQQLVNQFLQSPFHTPPKASAYTHERQSWSSSTSSRSSSEDSDDEAVIFQFPQPRAPPGALPRTPFPPFFLDQDITSSFNQLQLHMPEEEGRRLPSTPQPPGRGNSTLTGNMRPDRPAPACIPTSPLSPSARTQSHHSTTLPNDATRRAARDLHLPPFPRFHPAVYQSPSSSNANSPNVTRQPAMFSPRAVSTHQRQRSGVQQQIQQYQREVIARTTSSLVSTPPNASETPKAPHLTPVGSPGPATPLMLEEQGDYLTARAAREGSPREYVDNLIRKETDKRGLDSGHTSPAISPRC